MENPENPYQTPGAEQAVPPAPPEQPSSIPKVFGILHIIYAAIGGLVGLIGLGGGALMKSVFSEAMKPAEEAGEDLTGMTAALDSLMTVSMIQSVFSILFAVVLLVAGIKLLKYQQSGRKLSNLWAIGRIVVAVPLTFMAVNAQTALQEEVQKLSADTAAMDVSAAMGVGGVLGVIMVSLYPVISLIFVNQEKAKAALR